MRGRIGAAVTRVALTRWSVLQCSLAAMAAWELATRALGHPRPFFAPVAAVVCLGVSYSYRIRRVLELALGVTIGVGIADLLVGRIGHGAWQIGLTIALAMAVAQFFGGGNLVTAQAAVQASFLVALPSQPGGSLARWEDALIGGGCALLVAALLPPDPTAAVQRWAQALIAELAGIVEAAAESIRLGDPGLADATLDRARRTEADLGRWTEALTGAEEIVRLSPTRRNRRAELRRFRRALIGIDRAMRNMRVAVRRVAAVLDRGQRLPAPLAGVLDDLAVILHELHDEVGSDPSLGRASDDLLALARRLDPGRLEAATMSATVIVAQVRSAVVDLLVAVGHSVPDARAALPSR